MKLPLWLPNSKSVAELSRIDGPKQNRIVKGGQAKGWGCGLGDRDKGPEM